MVEKLNKVHQVDAEYDATQEQNLLIMVLNVKEHMASKFKQLQIESATRWSEAFSKDGKPDDPVMMDVQSVFGETNLKMK